MVQRNITEESKLVGRSTAPALTGSRIRQRRSALGLRQADLAKAVDISPSYLNLIEHGRRRIGGKLLIDIARALSVEPATLSSGADATVFDALHKAASDLRPALGAEPELDRIDELSGRFPGWSGVLTQQQKRIIALEAMINSLQDRFANDPVLAEAMHEILSSVAAIRSTADILVREPDLEMQWRARFHRNLHEEAERLSLRATQMLRHFEQQGESQDSSVSTAQETVEAMFDAAGHHFPAIELDGATAIEAVIDRAAGMEDRAARDLALDWLRAYAEDAARLPLAEFAAEARKVGYDPARLLHMGQGDVALILRRLAALPPQPDVPEFGLAICDASGALLFRKRINGFSIPRFGAGCPIWPLYTALSRPMTPSVTVLSMPNGLQFHGWAVAQPRAIMGFGQQPVVNATMLLRLRAEDESAGSKEDLPIGPGCHVCPREGCTARRAASVLT
ncbi:short-chain fatty acyl-CoA regulator family protein [Rhodobacteraceae bacterium XHP0102]|nr:short-chain fatty acyl-CoA regulator family protein [Rhodobacteraceae bacterium XHP0102]